MDEGVRFVESLVDKFPQLRDLYESHLFDDGSMLPHVFFWDFTQEVIQAFMSGDSESLDWKKVLEYLEGQMETGGPETIEIIVTSFLGYLPYPSQPGYRVIDELGVVMSRRFRDLRRMNDASGNAG